MGTHKTCISPLFTINTNIWPHLLWSSVLPVLWFLFIGMRGARWWLVPGAYEYDIFVETMQNIDLTFRPPIFSSSCGKVDGGQTCRIAGLILMERLILSCTSTLCSWGQKWAIRNARYFESWRGIEASQLSTLPAHVVCVKSWESTRFACSCTQHARWHI